MHANTPARMIEIPIMEWANGGLIAANTLLGVVLLNDLNLIAAGVGVAVTVFANLGKIAESVAHLNAIRKNGWLPLKKTPPTEETNEQ